MRILHTADWHFGRSLEGRDRLSEHAAFVDELVTIVEEEAVDAILIAGDIYDSMNPPAAAEELYYEALSRLSDGGRRPIVVIAGNHDQPDRLAAALPLVQSQNMYLVGMPIKEPLNVPIQSHDVTMKVAALPYPSESRLRTSFSYNGSFDGDDQAFQQTYDERIQQLFKQMTQSFSDDDINIATSHIFVGGGAATDSERPIEVGGAYTVRPTSLPEHVSYTALGHLHRPQWVHHAPAPTRYAGSPLSFSFNDTGVSKSVTVIDVVPREDAHIREIPLNSGKPLVKWQAKNGLQEVYKWLDESAALDSWVDLSIHSDHTLRPDDIQKIRRAHLELRFVRYYQKNNMWEREERRNLPIDELFKQFYEKKTGGATPDQEITELFLNLIDQESTEQKAGAK
ncbi:LOW QUALITY PROTEIN: exonuclease SbcD [Geomicrobium sp. JCM 19039]|nr:LOW QUALITY PROTEIN: exonuclease SbcD [Geomicrobium sp. JCM 19039]